MAKFTRACAVETKWRLCEVEREAFERSKNDFGSGQRRQCVADDVGEEHLNTGTISSL